MQTHIGRNVRNQWVLQFCGLQFCDGILGHRTALLTSPSARPPTNKGVLQKRSIAIWAVALHFAAGPSRRSPFRSLAMPSLKKRKQTETVVRNQTETEETEH